MDKKERVKIRAYLLRLAKEYEKNGFPLLAADIYKKSKPQKARNIYLSVARGAEKKKLFAIAADIYRNAGEIKKSRIVWKRFGNELEKKGLHVLAREVFEKSKPENPKYKNTRKFTFKATELRAKGRFKESRKWLIKAAKYREKIGDYKFASSLYFEGGDIKNAKRVWKIAKKC